MTKLHSPLILAAALVAACGGDDGGSAEPGMVNTASATGSVTQTVAVNTQMMNSMGPAVSSAIQAMTSANQSLVTQSAQRTNEIIELMMTASKERASFVAPAPTGTADCTPTMCTFDNYGDDNAQTGFTIDGTVSKNGDTITFDLDYHIVQPGMSFDWDISGSVTVTATSIDGAVHTKGTAQLTQGTVKWDIDVDYIDIVLDAQGCATGGSIHGISTYDVNVGGQSAQGYNVEGTATFGPACGAVTAS